MQSKRTQFAVGWLREYTDKKTGQPTEYISASAGGGKQPVKLMVEDEQGNLHKVESFAVYFNPDNSNKKAPHVTFVTNLD